MRKIGIVGGVGWASTVEYYAGICRLREERHRSAKLPGMPAMPEMTMESLDLSKAIAYLHLATEGVEASWSQFDEYHRRALLRLEAAGADFALMASNTPHHRFAAITRGIEIPVIDLFEAVATECARIGARQVLILGTALTMDSAVLREAFAKRGIAAAGPRDAATRERIAALITRMQSGRFEGAAERINEIARSACEHQANPLPVACLACTELSLAFHDRSLPSFAHDGITYISTSAVHIAAAFDYATS